LTRIKANENAPLAALNTPQDACRGVFRRRLSKLR
jgi:hypothetical protein